jgi:hypothetical protein
MKRIQEYTSDQHHKKLKLVVDALTTIQNSDVDPEIIVNEYLNKQTLESPSTDEGINIMTKNIDALKNRMTTITLGLQINKPKYVAIKKSEYYARFCADVVLVIASFICDISPINLNYFKYSDGNSFLRLLCVNKEWFSALKQYRIETRRQCVFRASQPASTIRDHLLRIKDLEKLVFTNPSVCSRNQIYRWETKTSILKFSSMEPNFHTFEKLGLKKFTSDVFHFCFKKYGMERLDMARFIRLVVRKSSVIDKLLIVEYDSSESQPMEEKKDAYTTIRRKANLSLHPLQDRFW